MIFGAIAVKTFNAKYFKTVTTGKNDLASRLLHTPTQEIKPNQHYFELFAQQTHLHQHITPCILPSIMNIEHQTTFSSPMFQPTLQAITPPLQQPLHSNNQPSPTISIQTLQFQSNNPIQDRLVYKKLQSIDAMCISVFDGHGGNMLAEYAAKKISQLVDGYLQRNLEKCDKQQKNTQHTITKIKAAIKHAYDQIQHQFYQLMESQLKTGNKDIFKIGSCALTIVVYKNYILIANSGDSQGMIITQDNEGLCYLTTNQQLNTSNAKEIERIQQAFREKDTEVFTRSKTNNKIYIKGILQPTRTLGDYYLKKQKHFRKVSRQPFHGPYISHKPEFNLIKIQKSFKHLIIASDGLWDFATKKEIMKIVQDFMKQQSEQQFAQMQQQQSQQLTEQDLNKTYISKPPITSTNQITLSIMLQDFVLQKCARRQKKTRKQLMQMKRGQRRDYCDDISIAVVSFNPTNE